MKIITAHPNSDKNKAIRSFWRLAKNAPVVEQLAELKRLSHVQFIKAGQDRVSRLKPKNRRSGFNRDKTRLFVITNQSCLLCGAKAQIRHHIIAIKNGGRNTTKNIVFLCKKCHAKIHPWLR